MKIIAWWQNLNPVPFALVNMAVWSLCFWAVVGLIGLISWIGGEK